MCWYALLHSHKDYKTITIRVFIQIKTSNTFFLLFYLADHRSYCRERKAPSDQLGVQRTQRTRPALSARLSHPLSSFTEEACRASVCPSREQGRSQLAWQWTVGLEVAVDTLRWAMSLTSGAWCCQARSAGSKSQDWRAGGESRVRATWI